MSEEATRSVETEITIDAPVEVVWKALTEADEMTRWFPLDARVEPGEGGSVYMSWENEFDATSPIKAWEENQRFAYAWDMDGTGPLVADFHLEASGGKTILRLVHSGFPTEASWDQFYDGVRTGWAFELQSLKHYVEEHLGAERGVVYIRWRAPVTLSEMWDRVVGGRGIDVDPDPGELTPGDSYRATSPTGDAWSGRILGCEPELYIAGTVDELGDGLIRYYMDPCRENPELSDLMVWFSVWDRPESEVAALRDATRDQVKTLFPDGESR